HVSIDALLATIARRRRRAAYPLWAGGALAIAAVGAGAAIALTGGDGDPCAASPPATPYDAVAIRRGLGACADGAATADRVIAGFEAWRADAGALRAAACRASRIDGSESPQLADLRNECVADTARRVSALGRALAEPTPALAEGAVAAVER